MLHMIKVLCWQSERTSRLYAAIGSLWGVAVGLWSTRTLCLFRCAAEGVRYTRQDGQQGNEVRATSRNFHSGLASASSGRAGCATRICVMLPDS